MTTQTWVVVTLVAVGGCGCGVTNEQVADKINTNQRPNQLLKDGNAALARGDTAAAVTSYRELQQKFEGLP